MFDQPLAILQINTRDACGGAEMVALDLHRRFRRMGHAAHLAVGYKRTREHGVLQIEQGKDERWPRRLAWSVFQKLQPWYDRSRVVKRICGKAHELAAPQRRETLRLGREDSFYPGSASVEALPPTVPDVVHAHNLHGSYFDLTVLAPLSLRRPTVLTLHDAWLLSGHCAHSFECDRWEMGCGSCPDLSIYPAVQADGTAYNWERKRSVFARSRLHVVTPCQWLMDRVQRSMLAPGMVSSYVIPYGIDLEVFSPGDKSAARRDLGIAGHAAVLLFTANGVRQNAFKDFRTMREAVGRLAADDHPRQVLFLALGEPAHRERLGDAVIQFVPFESDRRKVAGYYRAADVYIHAARADTFPCGVLEALACGCPVVATAVGGIPEQVKSLETSAGNRTVTLHESTKATGILVPAGDAEAMAGAVRILVQEEQLRSALGCNAAADARRRFDLHRHVDDYLSLYCDIIRSGVNAHPCTKDRPLAVGLPPQASPV